MFEVSSSTIYVYPAELDTECEEIQHQYESDFEQQNVRFYHVGGGQGTKRKRKDEGAAKKKKSKKTLSQYQDLDDPLGNTFQNPVIDFSANGLQNDMVAVMYELHGEDVWYGGEVKKISKRKNMKNKWRVHWNAPDSERYTDVDLFHFWEKGRLMIWRNGRWWRVAEEENKVCPSSFDCDTNFKQMKQSEWKEEAIQRFKMIKEGDLVRYKGL